VGIPERGSETRLGLWFFGIPYERYLPNADEDHEFDEELSAFVYALANNYESISYFNHDPLGFNISPETVLERVKIFLSPGIPSMFVFFGFPSIGSCDALEKGHIPYPCPFERAQWVMQ